MLKYSVEAINVILLPIHQVPGRPTFRTLWQLSQEIQECLVKIEHLDHPDEGYAGYMMTQESYVLYSKIRCQNPEEVENYFIVPTTAITDTNQKSEERKWQARKNLLDTYRNMRTALRQLSKRAINHAYHSGGMTNTGMTRQGFGNNEPTAILERLKILYGTPGLKDLDQAILCLHDPMGSNQPVYVMLRTTD